MTKIFSQYFEASRQRLIAEGNAANAFQNTTNKGNIREAFIKELLRNSTSKFCSVGSGEIIHPKMDVNETRNQLDVVLYNNRYPKLSGAGGVDMFFVETVSSTIEIKSTLKKEDIRSAAKVSKRIKSYPYAPRQRFNPNGMIEKPHPFCYLFAYNTDAKDIETISKWAKEISKEEDYNVEALTGAARNNRRDIVHNFLDGIFVLSRGFICLDALPIGIGKNQTIPDDKIWIYSEKCELELLWLCLNSSSELLYWNEIDLTKYIPPFPKIITNLDN